MNDLITVHNEMPITTSLVVAEKFEKRHDHVLEKIRNLACSKEFHSQHFRESNYLAENGKEEKMYLMTESGFTFIAMRFTGKEAVAWQEKFIEAFQKMRDFINEAEQNGYVSKTKERNEISMQQLAVYKAFKLKSDWFTAKEMAAVAKVAPRTSRQFCKYFLDQGLLDMMEVFPGHLYKYSDMADKRNPMLTNRLDAVAAVMLQRSKPNVLSFTKN